MDLILFEWDSIRLFRLRPEIRYFEAIVEVRAVIVHDCYRKHDVHAELCVALVIAEHAGNVPGSLTLKTSRLGPAILRM